MLKRAALIINICIAAALELYVVHEAKTWRPDLLFFFPLLGCALLGWSVRRQHSRLITSYMLVMTVTCLLLALALCLDVFNLSGWFRDHVASDDVIILPALAGYAVSVLLTLVIIPMNLLPRFRQNVISTRQEDQSHLDINFLAESFSVIKQRFRSVEDAVGAESRKISGALEDFEKAVKAQESRLAAAKKELETAKAEASDLKELSSLTKTQQELFLRTMSRGKYVDYVVGFALGILGTVIVEITKAMIRSEGILRSIPK